MLIVAACLCWVVDNNLTRKVSSHDTTLIACLKGSLAVACNTGLALFVLALHTCGTARTGAYFSVAPLFGVVTFWLAAVSMAFGAWLHLGERHEHDVHHRHAHPR